MKLMISTATSPSRCQCVMSLCQVSLGRSDSKRIQLERGRFLGLGDHEATTAQDPVDGRKSRHLGPPWLRCQAMVRAPASRPSSARRLRQATIWSSSTAEVRLAGTLGPRLRGTRAP
jgi:hypothetical protein